MHQTIWVRSFSHFCEKRDQNKNCTNSLKDPAKQEKKAHSWEYWNDPY